MKTEASGFPSHVVTDEHKRAFVANYELHEGIKLNIDNIKPNTGMKAISKLFLNSLWGRFGLNSNKTQQKLISEISDLYELFLDDQYDVKDLNFLNENVCQAFYTKNSEMHSGSVDTNVVILILTLQCCHIAIDIDFYILKQCRNGVVNKGCNLIFY